MPKDKLAIKNDIRARDLLRIDWRIAVSNVFTIIPKNVASAFDNLPKSNKRPRRTNFSQRYPIEGTRMVDGKKVSFKGYEMIIAFEQLDVWDARVFMAILSVFKRAKKQKIELKSV